MPIKYRAEITRSAERDVEEIGAYLATDSPNQAAEFISKAGTVTVSGKPSVDVPPGTLNSVLKQAGLK